MKRLIAILCFSVFLCSGAFFVFTACRSTDKAKIWGRIQPVTDSTVLTIKRLDINTETVLDTVKITATGKFSYTFSIKNRQPGFYYLYADNRRVAQTVVHPGDAVEVRVKDNRVLFEGSEDSRLLNEAAEEMDRSQHLFDSLHALFVAARTAGDAVRYDSLNRELGRVYIKQKQAALRFMFTHPKSFANIAVIYQRFSDELPLFANTSDAVYFKMLYDSLSTVYPKSKYVMALENARKQLADYEQLQLTLSDVGAQVGFPELCLPDNKAQSVCLSSLQGQVILLSFWHSRQTQLLLDNQDLLKLYGQYHDKGLEIYQVALDTDKTAWANAIKEQKLPWISVCDGYGVDSPSVGLYNVTKIPALFIINKDGDIVLKTSRVDEAVAAVKKLCRQ